MHHTYGSSSFPNGRSHPLDASSADVACSEYSWKAAFEHVRRTGKRPKRNLIWFDSQWQTASGEDEALIVKCETASQPVGVWQIVASLQQSRTCRQSTARGLAVIRLRSDIGHTRLSGPDTRFWEMMTKVPDRLSSPHGSNLKLAYRD